VIRIRVQFWISIQIGTRMIGLSLMGVQEPKRRYAPAGVAFTAAGFHLFSSAAASMQMHGSF
jgi:hypothetical protein